jgi:hypothetical protein
VEDLQAGLEKLLTECRGLRPHWQTCDRREEARLFNRLATDPRCMAFDVQAMIALKRAAPDGDIKKSRRRLEEMAWADHDRPR